MASESVTGCDLVIPHKDFTTVENPGELDRRLRENFNAIERWATHFRKNCLGGGGGSFPQMWCSSGSHTATGDPFSAGSVTADVIDTSGHTANAMIGIAEWLVSNGTAGPISGNCSGSFDVNGFTLTPHLLGVHSWAANDSWVMTDVCSFLAGDTVTWNGQNASNDQLDMNVKLTVFEVDQEHGVCCIRNEE